MIDRDEIRQNCCFVPALSFLAILISPRGILSILGSEHLINSTPDWTARPPVNSQTCSASKSLLMVTVTENVYLKPFPERELEE